jgi:hypothetical protein
VEIFADQHIHGWQMIRMPALVTPQPVMKGIDKSLISSWPVFNFKGWDNNENKATLGVHKA